MDNTRKKQWFNYYLPSYLYACLILAASSYSLTLPLAFPSCSDKLVHFAEYLIFGLLLARSYKNAKTQVFKKYFILLAVLTGAAWGLLDESYQSFVPSRGFELLDIVADSLGAAIAAISYYLILRGSNKHS